MRLGAKGRVHLAQFATRTDVVGCDMKCNTVYTVLALKLWARHFTHTHHVEREHNHKYSQWHMDMDMLMRACTHVPPNAEHNTDSRPIHATLLLYIRFEYCSLVQPVRT
jgi:hypothetical protein